MAEGAFAMEKKSDKGNEERDGRKICEKRGMYEVREAGPKGLGVFALQDIPAGTCIMEEKPMLIAPEGTGRSSFVLLSFLELSPGQKKSYMELHKHDRHVVNDSDYEDSSSESVSSDDSVTPGLDEMSTREKSLDGEESGQGAEEMVGPPSKSRRLATCPKSPSSGEHRQLGLQENASRPSDSEADVSSRDLPLYTAQDVLSTYYTNAFKLEHDDATFSGVCPETSRLNHSCLPNAQPSFNFRTGKHTIHVIKDVSSGDEICISYICGMPLTRQDRQKKLALWGFKCSCPACSGEVQDSDKRRIRLGKLQRMSVQIRPFLERRMLSTTDAEEAKAEFIEMESLLEKEGLLTPDLADV